MEDDRTDREGDRQSLKTLASVRGRVGITTDNRIYYVTAGWGHARSKLDVIEAGVPASVNVRSNGVVVGSGMDWAFAFAITQPIRIDDVVIIENEWGRIEEITSTYVVVRIWDLRRLIVPLTYFGKALPELDARGFGAARRRHAPPRLHGTGGAHPRKG